MVRRLSLIVPTVLLALSGALRAADDFSEIQGKIQSFKLDNGLTVILYARGDAPVVSCVTYVKTGSADEHVGITGIAHQLEHLAFKGTPLIGVTDPVAEQAALKEIDALYQRIQVFEQTLPAEMRDAFLSLLAQVTSTGGPAGAMGPKIQKQVDALVEGWAKQNLKLDEKRKAEVGELVLQYAEKVGNAEKFVYQNQYSNVIDRNGGTGLNAFTSTDRTVYHVSLPANKLELWASLESDRYMNIVPRQLEKEKQVVLEERRMRTDSSAFGKLYENFLGVAFSAHPYGVSVIGHRSDILGYNREKIMAFYRRNYIPSQTVVSVVGDIDLAATRKILTDYFGRIPAAPAPEPLVTVEPPQGGERRLELEFPAQPLLLLGYHIPERSHPDTPALVVLNTIATGGRSSRFYTRLVKTKKANSAGSWIGPGERFPRLFLFNAEPSEQNSTAVLEETLLAEIEKLKVETPTADEMKRVLTQYRAGTLRGLRSNIGLAQELADYQAIAGDWRALFREIQEIGNVTPEQVTAVAKKYLVKENRTVGRVVPLTQAKDGGIAPANAPKAPKG